MEKTKRLWQFRIYIAGNTPRANQAVKNLRSICSNHLANDYHIEVIDLVTSPHLAERDDIFALPALVRFQPPPTKKIIGDLSNREEVVQALELPAVEVNG